MTDTPFIIVSDTLASLLRRTHEKFDSTPFTVSEMPFSKKDATEILREDSGGSNNIKITLGKLLSSAARSNAILRAGTQLGYTVSMCKKRRSNAATWQLHPVALSPYDGDALIAKVQEHLQPHLITLSRRYIELNEVDVYGFVDSSKWVEEVDYFTKRLLNNLNTVCGKEDFSNVTQFIHTYVENHVGNFQDRHTDVSDLSPRQYEEYCADLLSESGWETTITPYSGDQGSDIVAYKGGIVLVVQCKRNLTGSTGNKAVQEVYAAKSLYDADHAAVVSPAGYTKSARTLAHATGVKLLHHSHLTGDLSFKPPH